MIPIAVSGLPEKTSKQNELNYKKLGLTCFLSDDDHNAVIKLTDKIIPLFRGYTINQIERALSNAIETLKAGYTIK